MNYHSKLPSPRDSAQYQIGGPYTFRRGCRMILKSKYESDHNNIGGNRQNLEKSMRKIWIADDGFELCQVDAAGAEAMVVSYLCKEAKYRSLFKYNVKPHTYLALKIFKDIWYNLFDKQKVDLCLNSSIEELSKLPEWKTLSEIIKSSDEWESSKRYYYMAKKTIHACVDKDTEVLTKKGWEKVSIVNSTDPIVVWSKEKMFFECVQWNTYNYNSNLIHFKEDKVDQLVTPNHKVLIYNNSKYSTRQAKDIKNLKGPAFPTVGKFVGGELNLTEEEIKFIVALQADGYIVSSSTARFHLFKERKCDRLIDILRKLKLNYRVRYELEAKNKVNVVYYVYDIKHLIDILNDKKFDYNLLNLSSKCMDIFLNELKYWDGCAFIKDDKYNSYKETYTSKHIQNLEVIKTISHLRGVRGTISSYIEKGDLFKMTLNCKKTMSRLNKSGSAKDVPYNGKVYCPTTSTGFFLIRRNGQISITGNSSYGMRENTLRTSILKETTGLINLSFEQAKEFRSSFFKEFPEILDWHQRVFREAKTKRQLRNLLGFPYNITDFVDENDYKDLIAWIPQSTIACITLKALVAWQEYVWNNNLNWHLLHETHDSFLTEAPKDENLENAKKMKEFIEQELVSPLDGSVFRMKSSVAVGLNWSSYKEKYNEDGLKEIKL